MLLKNQGLFHFQMALSTAHKWGWILSDRVVPPKPNHDRFGSSCRSSSKGWRMKFQLKKQPTQQINKQVFPKRWHCFWFMEAKITSIFFSYQKCVPRKSKSNLSQLEIRNPPWCMDHLVWWTFEGMYPHVLGPAEHFHWVHQWMQVNKCGSFDKTWIGHNLYPLRSHGRFLWNLGSLSHPPRVFHRFRGLPLHKFIAFHLEELSLVLGWVFWEKKHVASFLQKKRRCFQGGFKCEIEIMEILRQKEMEFCIGGEFEWKIFPRNFARRKLLLLSLVWGVGFQGGSKKYKHPWKWWWWHSPSLGKQVNYEVDPDTTIKSLVTILTKSL